MRYGTLFATERDHHNFPAARAVPQAISSGIPQVLLLSCELRTMSKDSPHQASARCPRQPLRAPHKQPESLYFRKLQTAKSIANDNGHSNDDGNAGNAFQSMSSGRIDLKTSFAWQMGLSHCDPSESGRAARPAADRSSSAPWRPESSSPRHRPFEQTSLLRQGWALVRAVCLVSPNASILCVEK